MCAASGMLLDWRVAGLLANARAGKVLHEQLNRADEIATVLLLLTIAVTCAAAAAFVTWQVRHGKSFGAAAAALTIPVLNPMVPFVARGLDAGLTITLASKAAAVGAAVLALATVRAGMKRAAPGA